MTTTATQRRFARWSMLISTSIGIIGFLYFMTRGELLTGIVVAVLLGAGGYWEYKRRLRDLEQADRASHGRDPFEERERRR